MEVLEPLSNFTAKIEEQSIKDDGAEARRWYRVSGKTAKRTLPTTEVAAASFATMNWIADSWGTAARVAGGPSIRDHVRAAIETLSEDAPSRHLFQHTGWRTLPDGRRVYLMGGGAVGHQDVEVELEEGLVRYQLPTETTEEQVRAGLKRSVAFLDVAPRRITAPLLGAAYLAPLSEVIVPDFTLWVWGATGNLKSTLTALMLSHYGDFDEKRLPLSFESTANALERSLFLAKDVPIVVDDFRPAISRGDAAQQDVKAQRLLRSVGNRQGRSRMNADTTLKKSYPPRGFVMATGETIPDGPAFESAAARSFTIAVSKESVDMTELTELQRARGHLPHAMHGYIKWLSEDWEAKVKRARAIFAEWSEEFRDNLGPDAHPRLPNVCAALYTGVAMLSDYAEDTLPVEDFGEKAEFNIQAVLAILHAGREHMGATKGGDPATRFLEILGSMFAGGQVYARDKSSDAAPVPDRAAEILNWKLNELAGEWEPLHGAKFIGWADKDFLYLSKNNSYAAVVEFAQRGGISFGISPKALWHSMAAGGHSITQGQRTDASLRVRGVGKRVVQVPRGAVFGDDANTL